MATGLRLQFLEEFYFDLSEQIASCGCILINNNAHKRTSHRRCTRLHLTERNNKIHANWPAIAINFKHNWIKCAQRAGTCFGAVRFSCQFYDLNINEANSYSVDLTIAGFALPLDVFKSLLECADCNLQTQLMHKMSIMLMGNRERYSP